ncbi:hypothetical protein MLD38_009004 [Melastoma candidum]|uniref:Uncharacterized protein n=1 Tax=Melastoma candidum TaxID=119954 RepID=A0ACB9RVS2_9MYRT|nr:hypothetical protein MLD38_009004 [Melastoma candidum]
MVRGLWIETAAGSEWRLIVSTTYSETPRGTISEFRPLLLQFKPRKVFGPAIHKRQPLSWAEELAKGPQLYLPPPPPGKAAIIPTGAVRGGGGGSGRLSGPQL